MLHPICKILEVSFPCRYWQDWEGRGCECLVVSVASGSSTCLLPVQMGDCWCSASLWLASGAAWKRLLMDGCTEGAVSQRDGKSDTVDSLMVICWMLMDQFCVAFVSVAGVWKYRLASWTYWTQNRCLSLIDVWKHSVGLSFLKSASLHFSHGGKNQFFSEGWISG